MPPDPAARFIFVQSTLPFARFDVFFNRPATGPLFGKTLQGNLRGRVRAMVFEFWFLIQRATYEQSLGSSRGRAFFREPNRHFCILIHDGTLAAFGNSDAFECRWSQPGSSFGDRNRLGLWFRTSTARTGFADLRLTQPHVSFRGNIQDIPLPESTDTLNER